MSSTPSWQLLTRSDFFNQFPHTFLINPPADARLPEDTFVWHLYAHSAFAARSRSIVTHSMNAPDFQKCIPQIQSLQSVLIFLPKEKQLARYIFKAVSSLFRKGTQVFLVGSKDTGIKSWASKAIEGFGRPHKRAIGNHCQLLEFTLDEPQSINEQTFWLKKSIPVAGAELELSFFPGVFSEGRVDEGTRLLLDHLPDEIEGVVCDFGSGSGIISQFVASQRAYSELHLCDLSALAIATSMKNLREFPHCHFHLHDGWPKDLPQFDWIISNPPFHQGKETNYDIATQFITAAALALNTRGALVLVFNQFLPWPALLEKHFRSITTLAANKSYKVIVARGAQ